MIKQLITSTSLSALVLELDWHGILVSDDEGGVVGVLTGAGAGPSRCQAFVANRNLIREMSLLRKAVHIFFCHLRADPSKRSQVMS